MVSIRRALVDCVVLSLQDGPVFYPCCKGCFSKINVEERDRCRCFKCGYSCTADLVGYRYRLSLKVARDGCIFGLTVFGACLNTFFGIDASGLQRLVNNLDDPVGTATRSALLLKAVQDCFTGRHLIFGIKLNESEPPPWIKGGIQNGSGNNSRVQVVASQMLHPKALGLEGCTVIRYYQSLLQKAVESEPGGADLNKNPTLLSLSLLVNPHYSPQSSFSDRPLWSSGHLSISALSSQHSDSSFTPTPPWEQSLRLVTPTAEQEEDGCKPDRGDEDDGNAEESNSFYPQKGDCSKDHEDSEETAASLLKKEGALLSQWTALGPGSPGHMSRAKRLSTKNRTELSTSNSVAWEDLPFSESLTEYFCEKQGCDVTEADRSAHKTREALKIGPQDQNLSTHSGPVSASDHLQVLMDITNTPAVREADGRGCSKHVCKNCVTSVNDKPDNNTRSVGCSREMEEHFGADVYNCSADLFTDSVTVNTVADTPNRTLRSFTKIRLLMSDKRRWSGKMSVTPSKHKLTQKTDDSAERLLPPDAPQLDFIPLSQSTPIMSAGPPASYRCSASVGLSLSPGGQESSDLESRTPAKISSSLCTFSPLVRPLCQRGPSTTTTSNSRSNKVAVKLRFRKSERTKRHLLPPQARRAAPNVAPTEKVNNRWDTSSGDVIASEGVNEMLIFHTPPSRAGRGSPRLRCVWEGERESGANCGETARDQAPRSLGTRLQTKTQGSEAVVGGSLRASPSYLLDEGKACDWSRDLFSDSV